MVSSSDPATSKEPLRGPVIQTLIRQDQLDDGKAAESGPDRRPLRHVMVHAGEVLGGAQLAHLGGRIGDVGEIRSTLRM